MITLSGFADEIDPDPRVQCAVLAALGLSHLEFRGAWGTGVLDLDDRGIDQVAGILRDAGIAVSCVASPIGKVDIGADLDEQLARMDRALLVAHRLQAPYVRLFSFFPPPGGRPEDHREEVVRRLRALAERAAGSGVVLLHENEKGIFGDVPARVLDLLDAVPGLRAAYDPANFVQVGVDPWVEAFPVLGRRIAYVHVKDALRATGQVVPAGLGDGGVRETVRALAAGGFAGFLSLEPHLAAAHGVGGFSGPAAFGRATRALTAILDDERITYA